MAMDAVFPTCVGMNRDGIVIGFGGLRVPHVCGDEPMAGTALRGALSCSPRVWG